MLGAYNLIKKFFSTRINESRGIIVFHGDSLQMIDYKMKCLEITISTYIKTPITVVIIMKKYIQKMILSKNGRFLD